MRDARFWILAATVTAHGAATSTMTVHIVGYLASRGHPATVAASVAGLLGVLSVTGRLLLAAARRRLPVTTIVAAAPGQADWERLTDRVRRHLARQWRTTLGPDQERLGGGQRLEDAPPDRCRHR